MRALAATILALVFLAGAIMLGDASALGRLALALNQPRIAARLLDDPYWSGIALYRLGHFNEAAERFRAAGKAGFYNRGNTLARLGRYSEAIAYYDAVLFYSPDDEDARANRALVNALIEKAETQTETHGSIMPKGAATASKTDGRTKGGGAKGFARSREQDEVMRVYSGQAIIASRQWLATLSDEPGRYLKLRIVAEHERRRERGIAAPQGSDPW